jgi:hypothetical protein
MYLLQYRGAKWFKGLVQMPGERVNEKRRKGCCCLPSPTQILDKLQGPLAPVVALLLWVLLVIGTLPRSWFYIANIVLSWGYSMRVLIAIATKRARSIARIAELQRLAPGTLEDKRRRMRTLKAKTVGVVLDVFFNVFGAGVTVVSYIAAGSFFSSRRLIVNEAVAFSIGAIAFASVGFRYHKKINKELQLHARVHATTHAGRSTMNTTKRVVVVETELDGMSVLEQSCFHGGAVDGRTEPSGGGLFSEVETNAKTT